MSLTLHGTNGITFPDASTQASGKQAVKAWALINGTGTVSIYDSYNVSSITDNGTGDYTANFTSALSSVNYATAGSTPSANPGITDNSMATHLTTSCRFTTRTSGFALSDYDPISFIAIGD